MPTRTVELAVPADAVIPARLLGDVAGVTRRGFKTSVPVTAFTLKAKTTTDAISAAEASSASAASRRAR